MLPVTLATAALLAAPPSAPLDADVVDASAMPTVVFDVVTPQSQAITDLTPAMLQLDGGSVQAVVPVDPTQIAIALVIDDSPTMTDQAVTDGQGASIELIRGSAPGTQISLSTPSGLSTLPTTDQAANISRISGIVSGAPDVVPFPNLVLDAATRLAASPSPDRHLVVVAARRSRPGRSSTS